MNHIKMIMGTQKRKFTLGMRHTVKERSCISLLLEYQDVTCWLNAMLSEGQQSEE